MLEELYVYVRLNSEGWVPCGLLQHDNRGRLSSSAFRYGRKYLRRPGALAIDPIQLPLGESTYDSPEGFALFNGLRDAAPDGWGRYMLEKRFGRALSELEFLAASGPDRVGALAFSDDPDSGPKVYSPEGFLPPEAGRLDLGLCAGAVHDVERSAETDRLKEFLRHGPSLGGARPKATVSWNGRATLAKFGLEKDEFNEPLIEYAAMTLAARCGLDVPAVEKTEAQGRAVYLVERFDRRPEPVPFVSALTLTGWHETDHAAWSYPVLADAILKYASDPERDLRELFSRMVFNILVYNNDDHPRNTGFLGGKNGAWDLSPLYDVTSAGVRTQTFALAMAVGVDGKKASLANALSSCHRFRLSKDKAQGILERLVSAVAGWREHFAACGVGARDIAALENSFSPKSQ
ncbi:MAG: type II toxin-antitoxin system HipA family toxin [Elusimicrobia bacterium]|nr:type II toxin-antitoxin system HipA family toxin [Elusimicrobiota bacterium]